MDILKKYEGCDTCLLSICCSRVCQPYKDHINKEIKRYTKDMKFKDDDIVSLEVCRKYIEDVNKTLLEKNMFLKLTKAYNVNAPHEIKFFLKG